MVGVGEVIEAVSEVDAAGGAALEGAKHRFHVEQPAVPFCDRRDANAEVELEDAEEQEQEAVVARESSLERGLLDLVLGLGAVARKNVADVVEHHCTDAVLLAREREA